MTIGGRLDALRSVFPDCSLAAFVDLSTGMVLCASASEATRQEDLEDLCDAAVTALDGVEASAMQKVLGGPQAMQAFGLSAQGLQCYIRSPLASEEALCLRCAAHVEIDRLARQASDVLRAIASDG